MPPYTTPGVYIEEISTLPPSVAEVSTAIPAFIGYTEKRPPTTNGPSAVRVKTLLEFESVFGGPKPSTFTVTVDADSNLASEVARVAPAADFLLYYLLSLYFKNGGGPCFIISVGDYASYSADGAESAFTAGLTALEKEDEPTLIVLADAANLLLAADYYDLCQDALVQCEKLKDRFAILDVLNEDNSVDTFRNEIGNDNLMYGAAYYPYLNTSLNYRYNEDGVTIQGPAAPSATQNWAGEFDAPDGISVTYTGAAGAPPTVSVASALAPGETGVSFAVDDAARTLTIHGVQDETAEAVATAWEAAAIPGGFDIATIGAGDGALSAAVSVELALEAGAGGAAAVTLASIKSGRTELYSKIKRAMMDQRVVLPPSAAVAGVYARVDRQRGVWKAPANVSLLGVDKPVLKITEEDQGSLNVHPEGGKSINAIREFTGKGTLVWGARTLAGNDNEWRYVSVRRLFNLIEESTKKASAFAVFEPNDATTWLKVKGMIESYLYSLWERGALAGPSPETAYYVNVGLNKTMTTQDILEGRMIVEIGVAAVRPAEFIIIRFMHKLQEA